MIQLAIRRLLHKQVPYSLKFLINFYFLFIFQLFLIFKFLFLIFAIGLLNRLLNLNENSSDLVTQIFFSEIQMGLQPIDCSLLACIRFSAHNSMYNSLLTDSSHKYLLI